MHTSQQWVFAYNTPSNANQNANQSGQITRAAASFQPPVTGTSSGSLAKRKDWLDEESRRYFMEACVEQDIAYQIASNRRARGMGQKELAKALKTRQSAISRLEDPTYGRHTIATLVKIAHAFDCALVLRLAPYSQFAEIVEDTSDASLYAAAFHEEILTIGN